MSNTTNTTNTTKTSKTSKTTITLTNSLHGTSTKVRVNEGRETLLEYQTVYRIRKALCPEGCDKCTTPLKQIGETNPIVEDRDGDIVIFYKVGEESIKKVKISEGDREDKEDKEKASNSINFTELEAKIMSSALDTEEKSKLFNFIREIRDEYREEEGLDPIGTGKVL